MAKTRDYIFDVTTKNLSFLQTSSDLAKLGIKNNMFFLKLYDQSLRKVDPFSPHLSREQMIAIINECIINPWYFIRECVRIPEQGGTGIPYQLHRANLASTFCFLNGIDHYVVIPRQKGKTQSAIAIINWAFLFGTTASEFMFINKREADANNNLQRLKDQRDLLPNYLQMKIAFDDEGDTIKGNNNVRSLSNPTTGNKIVTKPSATSKERAEGIGRGCTQPVHYYDEVEFTDHIKTIVQAAGPAYIKASENARRNHAAYCRVFTSTPGDLDSQACQQALELINGTCPWTEKMYDWTRDEIEEYMAKNSGVDDYEGNGIVYIEYHYQQLGEGEEWLKRMRQVLANDASVIKREVFLKRMRGSSESPFNPEDLEALQELQGKPIEELMINKYFKVDIYEQLKRDVVYFVGVDVSNGYGQDNSAVTIINPYTLKPVAEFKSPYIGVPDLVKFLTTLVRKHIPRALLIIERNANGESVISYLRQDGHVAGNVYFDDTRDPIADSIKENLDDQGFLKLEALKRKMYGVWTGGKSRDQMINLLETHMNDYKEKFVTANVINDILSLVIKKGKIQAGVGFHDDSIMSYLVALYVFYYGNNLHRFGFVKGFIPDEDERNKGMTYEETVEELPEELRQHFPEFSTRTEEDYTNHIMQEIQNAKRYAQDFDKLTKPVNYSEDYDTPEDDTLALDLFDELNS